MTYESGRTRASSDASGSTLATGDAFARAIEALARVGQAAPVLVASTDALCEASATLHRAATSMLAAAAVLLPHGASSDGDGSSTDIGASAVTSAAGYALPQITPP